MAQSRWAGLLIPTSARVPVIMRGRVSGGNYDARVGAGQGEIWAFRWLSGRLVGRGEEGSDLEFEVWGRAETGVCPYGVGGDLRFEI